MSISENTTQLSEGYHAPAAVGPSAQMLPAFLPEPASGVGVMAYLHALRRHWIVALFAGLFCGAAAFALTWWLRGSRYEPKSLLEISPTVPRSVFPTAENQATTAVPTAFETYKDTQAQILKSRFVLLAALRDEKFKSLSAIQRADRNHEAVEWLNEKLRAQFSTKNTQLMQVSIIHDDPKEGAEIVNGVVHAYMEEVVNGDTKARAQRLSKLDGKYAEKHEDVRKLRAELKATAEQLGTSETDVLTYKQQLAVQRCSDYTRELARAQFERDRVMGQIRAFSAQAQSIDAMDISEYEVQGLAMNEQTNRDLVSQLNYYEIMVKSNEQAVVPGPNPYALKIKRDLDNVQTQYNQFLQKLRDRIRATKRADVEKELRKLQSDLAVLDEQLVRLDKKVADAEKESDKYGKKSPDVEMMRSELKQIEQVLGGIADERERLRVEMDAAPRVVVRQFADPGEAETGVAVRVALALAGLLFGFAAPALAIALWDVQAGRINSPSEVSKGLGLPVIGTVPRVPGKVSRLWRVRLTESMDALAARLLHKAEVEQTRVVLITSAMGGEGKTTVAKHLASSLASKLKRTLLVDFDLRRPSLHRDEDFSTSLEPGVCDALRNPADVANMIVQKTEYLSVLAAGRLDRDTLALLANGAAGPLFDQLRAQFDFVIVDSSPILPVADTRLICQKADAVILSVFRDVSQGPQVMAACEILDAFGVRSVDTVVTGGQRNVYGKGTGYGAGSPDDDEPAIATVGPAGPEIHGPAQGPGPGGQDNA